MQLFDFLLHKPNTQVARTHGSCRTTYMLNQHQKHNQKHDTTHSKWCFSIS